MTTATFSKLLAVQLIKQIRLETAFTNLACSMDLKEFLNL